MAGRPTSYRESFAGQAAKLCKLGATDADLADFFGVSIRTTQRWQAEFPAFCRALKLGKEQADQRVERSLFQRAIGYTRDNLKIFMPAGATEPIEAPYREEVPPDVTACIFWLKNRKPEQWRDVHRQEHTGADGGPIKTEDVNATRQRVLAELGDTAERLRVQRLGLVAEGGTGTDRQSADSPTIN